MRAARSTRCCRSGAVPVINENDTVATAEIRYGDNDRLAARVAQMVGADCLVLLSDIDGLYTANPNEDPTPNSSPECSQITPRDRSHGGRRGQRHGLGRHADQDCRGQDRRRRGLSFVHFQGRASTPAASASRRARAAPGSCPPRPRWPCASSGSRATLKPAGRNRHRRRRGTRAAERQEPVAGGRDPGGRALRTRRYGQHHRPRRQRGRAGHLRLFGQRRGAHHRPQVRRDRDSCWVFAAAMKSCIGMIWFC